MVVNLWFIALTSFRINDYVDVWVDLVRESFVKAGINVDIHVLTGVYNPPIKCFDWSRAQYYAPCILEWLLSIVKPYRGDNRFFIGIGYIDGYDHGLNFVFGEADPYNNVAVVFTKRLDPLFYGLKWDFNLYVERTAKEIVHETGHLLGLKHCSVQGCVMNFSNSVYDVDGKSRFFCSRCASMIKLDV